MNRTEKQFEEAMRSHLTTKEQARACASISREQAIEFAEWINRPDTTYAQTYNKLWCTNDKDDITAVELFDLFLASKEGVN